MLILRLEANPPGLHLDVHYRTVPTTVLALLCWRAFSEDCPSPAKASAESAGFQTREAQMPVSERAVGAITVLEVDGKLVLGATANELRDKVLSCLEQGQQQFVLDMAKVPYVDSSGLGELVQAYSSVTKRGGALKLVHLTTKLRDLLVITKLATIFDCYDSEEAALASFVVPA
jgi:anti-sigma B factor antagonist